MILPLFGMLCALALVLIYFGGANPEFTGASLVGFSVLFLLGVQLAVGGLDYQSAAVTATNYTYLNATLASTTASEAYVYSTARHLIIGPLLSIIAGFGFVFTLMFKKPEEY